MLSATFDDRGGGANDPAFSVDLTMSRAIFHDPEILYIIRGTCCTSQGDPDSSFQCGHTACYGSILGDRVPNTQFRILQLLVHDDFTRRIQHVTMVST